MARMTDRKSALMWAIGWWFFRRWVRRRAALAVAGVAAGASSRRGGLRAVVGVLALVGVLGWGIPIVAVIVAVVCMLLFQRTVGR
jgi:hypothetical protein